jgi:F0F1-type ATP synthase delta subunit
MNRYIKSLQDIAFNLGYTDGLVRVCQNRGLIIAERQAVREFTKLCQRWEKEKSQYIKSMGEAQCPVMKQLIKVLLEDRTKHFNLGLKACSNNYSKPKA